MTNRLKEIVDKFDGCLDLSLKYAKEFFPLYKAKALAVISDAEEIMDPLEFLQENTILLKEVDYPQEFNIGCNNVISLERTSQNLIKELTTAGGREFLNTTIAELRTITKLADHHSHFHFTVITEDQLGGTVANIVIKNALKVVFDEFHNGINEVYSYCKDSVNADIDRYIENLSGVASTVVEVAD